MRLLESQPETKARFAGGTIFSIIVHVGLISLAVYATATAGVRKANRDREEKVNFVAVKEPPPPPEAKKEPPPPKKKEAPKPKAPKPEAPRLPKQVAVAPPKGFQVVPPVINIPTRLPAIDLSRAVTRESDFSGKGTEGGTGKGVEGGTGKAGSTGTEAGEVKNTPYTAAEVEKVVALIGGATPEYPARLRDNGVQGEVVAQFVVGENGRYESGTLKIIKATDPAFADAVKRALPGMRFSAAQVGGQKVKQLVQMPFQFNLRT